MSSEQETTPNTGKGFANLRKRLAERGHTGERVGDAVARMSGERPTQTILDVAAFQSSI